MELNVEQARSLYKEARKIILTGKLILLSLYILGLAIIYVLFRTLTPIAGIVFIIALFWVVLPYGIFADKLNEKYNQHVDEKLYSFLKLMDTKEINYYNRVCYDRGYSFDMEMREWEYERKEEKKKLLEKARKDMELLDPDGLYQKYYWNMVNIAIKRGVIAKGKDYDEDFQENKILYLK